MYQVVNVTKPAYQKLMIINEQYTITPGQFKF